jgi:Protein of unknown function (DUF1015)
MSALIAPPVHRVSAEAAAPLPAPENILRIALAPRGETDRPAAAAQTLGSWLATGILLRERRPGLWIYRQTIPREPEPLVVPMLVGLVRLGTAGREVALASEAAEPRTREERLAMRRALRADFEPCLLVTRAPLSGALSTTRQADLSAENGAGVRHDAFRIHDYAQHVELQGLVKNADVVLAEGQDLWEDARNFEADPEAAKLPGARFKLCAILDEAFRREHRGAPLPAVALGFFGVSLEDPVY